MDPVTRDELRRDPTQWMSVHSQYFLFYVAAPKGTTFTGTIPTLETFAGDPEVKIGRQVGPQPWHRGRVLLPAMEAAAGNSATMTIHCYAGPKKLQLLSELDGGVAKIMDMDRFMFFHPAWMGWLTKLLLSCLVGLKGIFSGTWGYGWAIIVITVGVKLLFFPLSHKSTQSMRKMQELQPQLKELREKYKDDPQKMYRKQQELFKENNVSQLGGCLPMLVQIPVFFGLYNTFRSAIELRQASFLWVADLSLPDTLPFSPAGLPIRPLAIIMSGSMLLQQKLMPSGDANQQRMMMFMSLFFLWIFYGMPAGLTLYWTTNQILTIAQTLITRRLEERKKAAEANSGGPAAERA
jgi:YidC/Oxa1 family membrane protein insertase